MKRWQRVAAAMSVAFLSTSADAATPVALERLFPHEAPIEADATGLVRLALPPEVIRACRPDLSDLRVFDAAGREVAFWLDSKRLDEAVQVTESFDPEIVGLDREEHAAENAPSRRTETYEITVPPRGPAVGTWELVIVVSHPRYVRAATVRRAGEGKAVETLAEAEPIFRLAKDTHRTRLALPPIEGGTLQVEISGQEDFYLEPRFRYENGRRLESASRSAVALEELSREYRDGQTVVELARPSGLVPDLLRVESSTGSLSREITVWDERPGSGEAKLGHGKLYRLDGKPGRMRLRLAPARGESLRVVIRDGDSPPLTDLRFSAVIRRPILVFDLSGKRGTLRFGGGRARRPHYDLTGLRSPLKGSRAELAVELYAGGMPLARLGEIRPNPAFDATPALAFAMHAGAEIDERIFSHRRPLALAPSSEGLSRLVLDPADTAHSLNDLADLRVVGGDGRQWPYLIRRSARTRRIALTETERVSRKRRTTYALALPTTPLTLHRLTLGTEAPYFDRTYSLMALDEHGLGQRIASGRVKKDARRPRPTRIGFSSRPVYGLELVLEDGDDAPLRFHTVTAHASVPEIFLVAPRGEYRLLLGNPDLPAPRYELERVRSLVLAASSGSATVGPLEPNPVYSLAARLGTEDGPSATLQAGLVWGVLLVAVAVLAWLTFRVVTQTPDSGDKSAEP
ncbi:MAG: DUF3999 domain-containing protein [Proteobacteria bacterium]|nr:DUF3999 domain-containing protein [Pseudomonadota bacterium]